MQRLNAALFYTSWLAFTLAMGFVCLPALISTRSTWRVADTWCDISLWLLKITCGVTLNVAKLSSASIKLYAANHESTLDTLILWRALHHPAFVLKRELTWIPVFGWYLWRTKPIAIDRASSRAMESIVSGAALRMAQGRNIIVFPQGTRSAPEKHTPYKRGVAVLSSVLNVSVQPIMLATHQVWPKTSLLKYSGTAYATLCPVMPACEKEHTAAWLRELAAHIQQARAITLSGACDARCHRANT